MTCTPGTGIAGGPGKDLEAENTDTIEKIRLCTDSIQYLKRIDMGKLLHLQSLLSQHLSLVHSLKSTELERGDFADFMRGVK